MTKSVRILSEAGYKALSALAADRPEMFISGQAQDSQMVESEMNKLANDGLWSDTKVLHQPIEILNEIDQGGPGADYEHAKILIGALGEMRPREYSNELLWASLNCFPLAKYTAIRWKYVPRKSKRKSTHKDGMANFVSDHWLKYGTGSRRRNASARLFWLNECARRFSDESEKFDHDAMLKFLSGNVNVYHQMLARPYLMGSPRLMAKLVEIISQSGNEYLTQTKYISDFLRALNIRGGAQSLDFIDGDELDALIRESLPPKER